MIRGLFRTVSLLAVLLSLGGDAWHGASGVEGLRADARYAAMLSAAVDVAPAEPVAAGPAGNPIVPGSSAVPPGADPVPPHAECLAYHANAPPFRS